MSNRTSLRKFLNEDGGLAAIDIDLHDRGADVGLSDCNRTVNLDFDISEYSYYDLPEDERKGMTEDELKQFSWNRERGRRVRKAQLLARMFTKVAKHLKTLERDTPDE